MKTPKKVVYLNGGIFSSLSLSTGCMLIYCKTIICVAVYNLHFFYILVLVCVYMAFILAIYVWFLSNINVFEYDQIHCWWNILGSAWVKAP